MRGAVRIGLDDGVCLTLKIPLLRRKFPELKLSAHMNESSLTKGMRIFVPVQRPEILVYRYIRHSSHYFLSDIVAHK